MNESQPLKFLRSRRRTVIAIVAGIAVGGTAFYASLVRSDVRAASAAPSTIPDRIVTLLGRHYITLASTTDATAIAPADAINAARDSNPLVADASGSASLVLFTDTAYGPETASDSGASQISPTFVNREAYAVLFSGVEVPVLGPPGVKSSYYTGTLVAFVDPHTGAFLESIALNA